MGNQTSDTLQNVTLELATLGDLKLVERPSPVVMGPLDFCSIKANVKVSSTENGIIFGNIVYDCTGAASDRNVGGFKRYSYRYHGLHRAGSLYRARIQADVGSF